MSSIPVAAASHFLTGLALIALAAMTLAALGRVARRPATAWGLLATVALALAEWCDVAATNSALPLAWKSARLLLEIVALAGLIEVGRYCAPGPCSHGRGRALLPRWIHLLVGGLVLAAVLSSNHGALDFLLRLAILWQAGWLAASYFTATTTTKNASLAPEIAPHSPIARTIVGGLLVYLAAGVFALPPLSAAAALVALAAAYWAFGQAAGMSRQSRLIWRSAWPVGFGIFAIGGCLLLPVADGQSLLASTDSAAASDDASASEADQHGEEAGADEIVTGAAYAAADDPFVTLVKRYGLGVSPIILLVLLVWGLSRLPGMH